jgi:hypothetical protein
MPAFTTNQWAVVALVLVAGWLLGLMSRSGSGKWRRAYDDEHANHLALRRDYDAQRRDYDAHLHQHGLINDSPVRPIDNHI